MGEWRGPGEGGGGGGGGGDTLHARAARPGAPMKQQTISMSAQCSRLRYSMVRTIA